MALILIKVLTLVYLFGLYLMAASDDKDEITGNVKAQNSWLAYQTLFETQRKAQLEGIKILSGFDTTKQYEMLDIMVKKIIQTVKEARVILTRTSFTPGDDFPQNETVRDSLSQVFQNTVLFGDMALRFPAFIHRVYDKEKELREIINWCIGFTNSTGVLEHSSAAQTLHLAAQELGLIEPEENFINPYKQKAKEYMEQKHEEVKKTKKKAVKGPRLTRKTEL